MDSFITDIKIICLISILTGVLSVLIPPGAIKNAFTTLCAVVMIYACVVPFADIDSIISSVDFSSGEEVSKRLTLDERTAQVMIYEKIVADSLESNFSDQSYKVKVSVEACNSNEEIHIQSITVTGKLSDEEKSVIENSLKESFQDAIIIFTEETDG